MFIIFNDGENDIHCWRSEHVPRIGDEVCVSQDLDIVHKVVRVIWLTAVAGRSLENAPDRVIVQVEWGDLGIP